MSDGSISIRYAKAFLNYATDLQAEEDLYQKMRLFRENFSRHPDLDKALMSPVLSASDKEMLLSTAIGIEPEEVYIKIIRLLIKNHRERYLNRIALIYQELYRKAKGITDVKVTTAVKVAKELAAEIEKEIVSLVKGEYEIEYFTEEKIIGGYILEIDNTIYDASVRTELNKIKKELIKK
ncbi:MAG: F0F1 ATP synthase subunit delta [Culturomica sp.]|jgi:F-type H+-transporting ATPase subunit delta|nr:F0F1 ATP synthase subunit delta [Culturomica sp.]